MLLENRRLLHKLHAANTRLEALATTDPLTDLGDDAIPAPELDGPAFHAARAALDAAKQERRVFAFSGFGDTVAGLAAYYSALYWSWTTRQRRVACGLRFWDYDEALQRLGVHPTAVSHMKRRLAWPLVAAGDTMFQAALREAS